jgi:glycerol-1-phosphate dehydrogenase [NAD(P)+]
MASSGYADLIAKNPAGVDWIIADSVGLDPIVPEIWELIQGNLLTWISKPKKIRQKDKEVFGRVFKGLTVSGFAMQYMKRSRPVSGAEHLMSHIWEMNNHTYKGKHISHGFKVGIGSLASVALMETMIQWELTDDVIAEALAKWPTWEKRKSDVEENFKGMIALNDLLVINKKKYINKDQLEERLHLLSQNWENLKKQIKNHLIPYSEYKHKLKQAGCPVSPGEIGLTRDQVVETYVPAQMMRNRYSILDLAYETGMLGLCSFEIMDSDIYLY